MRITCQLPTFLVFDAETTDNLSRNAYCFDWFVVWLRASFLSHIRISNNVEYLDTMGCSPPLLSVIISTLQCRIIIRRLCNFCRSVFWNLWPSFCSTVCLCVYLYVWLYKMQSISCDGLYALQLCLYKFVGSVNVPMLWTVHNIILKAWALVAWDMYCSFITYHTTPYSYHAFGTKVIIWNVNRLLAEFEVLPADLICCLLACLVSFNATTSVAKLIQTISDIQSVHTCAICYFWSVHCVVNPFAVEMLLTANVVDIGIQKPTDAFAFATV